MRHCVGVGMGAICSVRRCAFVSVRSLCHTGTLCVGLCMHLCRYMDTDAEVADTSVRCHSVQSRCSGPITVAFSPCTSCIQSTAPRRLTVHSLYCSRQCHNCIHRVPGDMQRGRCGLSVGATTAPRVRKDAWIVSALRCSWWRISLAFTCHRHPLRRP